MEKLFRHPWLIVGVIMAITVFFALQLPKTEMDNNTTSFLPEDNPAKITARHFEREYGDSITIMVGLERPYGTVFDGVFLRRVKEFSEALELMPLVKSVNSLMSTQYIASDNESIIVTDLVGGDFSGAPEEIAELKRRVNSWDMYRGALVSEDWSSTQIVAQLNATVDHAGDGEVLAVLLDIRDRAKETFADLAVVYTAGQSVVAAALTEAAYGDLRFLIPLVAVALLTVLTLSFRRFSYVMLPLLTVLVAVIWSVGAMALLGVRMTLLCIMLPVVLFAVGSAYAIHLVSHYKDETTGKTLGAAEHRKFVFALTRGLAKPILLAALTTFAGFVSFCFGPLTSMRDFGIFSSAGVVIAFLTALTLVPSLLLIRGPRTEQAAARKKAAPRASVERLLSSALAGLARKKVRVFAVTILVVAVSIAGSARLVIENSMVEFFHPASEVSRSNRFMSEHFGGSTQIIVSVEAESTEILLHPDTLAAAEGLRAYLLERVPKVGKVTGFTDLIKRMNQMFNVGESPEGIRPASPAVYPEDFEASGFGFADFGFDDLEEAVAGPPLLSSPPALAAEAAEEPAPGAPPASPETPVTFAMLNAAMGKNPAMDAYELARELERMTNYGGYGYYEIPTDPAKYGKETPEDLERLAANYLALLSGDVSGSFANDPLEPTAFEMIALVNSQWQEDTDRVIDAINRYVAANFPANVRTLVGGGAAQEAAIARLTTSSQISSILITAIAVLLIVAVSNKSLIAGLCATLPLSITILFVFAVMGFLRITLNMATALIASLAVGIGIDYTIHFMETFKREFRNGGDYLYRTFATSGKAILINAVSVGASFAVLGLSQLTIVGQFGALVCLSMGSSAVVSLTVIPALLEATRPKFIFGEDDAAEASSRRIA